MNGYPERLHALQQQWRAGARGLAKETSNLFRERGEDAAGRLDVRPFQHVLNVDRTALQIDAEGMTPYDALLEQSLRAALMPCVVPQLRSITLGGAVAGIGIESSSFRHGLVHESVTELDVLLGDGSLVTCTPDNEHSDLFYGFPNSYGTLGYALRVRCNAIRTRPYVFLEHVRCNELAAYFECLDQCCDGDADFVDGVVFAPDEMYVTTGRFVDHAAFTSDYTFEHIYYRSIREREVDYLTVWDYLWRWDTDWFWCSKNLFAQQPLVRRLLGRDRLNSRFYQRVMRWNSRWALAQTAERALGLHRESVICDVDVPIDNAAAFCDFLLRDVGVLPIWICPVTPGAAAERFTLFPMPRRRYVNFGFWDVVRSRARRADGYLNRRIEQRVRDLGGLKSLYSTSYFTEAEFWTMFDRDAYAALKARYDPDGHFEGLYEKCVRGR
jgi:FAD/FMN-containing dehydrogenase